MDRETKYCNDGGVLNNFVYQFKVSFSNYINRKMLNNAEQDSY